MGAPVPLSLVVNYSESVGDSESLMVVGQAPVRRITTSAGQSAQSPDVWPQIAEESFIKMTPTPPTSGGEYSLFRVKQCYSHVCDRSAIDFSQHKRFVKYKFILCC